MCVYFDCELVLILIFTVIQKKIIIIINKN